MIDDVNSVRYIHCASIESDLNGFDLISLGGTIQSIEYIDCRAVGNNRNGFSSNSAGVSSNIAVVSYENCISCLNNANIGMGLNGDGFYFDGQSFLVKSCSASENEGSGFNLSLNAFGIELLGNSAQSNVVYGIQDQGSSNLIYLTNDPSSLNVQVIDCVLSKNKDFGIYAEAENTVIKECSVVGRDIGIYISSLANNAHILSNYVSNNGTSGIVNDSVTSYIWGNNGSKNGTNCSGAVAPINMLVSLAAQYWANVEN